MITKFKEYLEKSNLAKTTMNVYISTVEYYLRHYDDVSVSNLLAYKGYLLEHFKPQTVNLRIQAINKYLDFLDYENLKMKFVKVQ